MADENEVAPEGKSGGLKKIIILAVVGLVLIGGSVGGTLFFLGAFEDKPTMEGGDGSENTEDSAAAGTGEDGEAEVPKAAAIYIPLKPAIVVNYNHRGRQRFVEAKITLMLRSEAVLSAVELHMPMIRNSMVMTLGGQIYEDLQTPEGKEQLRQQLLTQTQKIIEAEVGEPGVEQVLFTNFVMQ